LQRIYRALARHAALLLDNVLMLDRVSASHQKVEQQSELLRGVLDNIPVGVMLLEYPGSRPIVTNSWLGQLLGVTMSAEEQGAAVGQQRLRRPGTDRPLDLDELPSQRALHTKKTAIDELEFLRPDGQRIALEASAVPLLDDRGEVNRVIMLLVDLTARKRAEQERTRMQDEIIRVQAAALTERSSPLIPITDEILVLPLIGSIDTQRGNQVLDSVLQGASQRGARVTIIDITGVTTIDTAAAAALTGAAQALRLLGVEPVLTGIRAEVAQTLVGLGVNLRGITTRSTLQAGINYALQYLGKARIS
jgi:rsbT co-antagonist protein RsbR